MYFTSFCNINSKYLHPNSPAYHKLKSIVGPRIVRAGSWFLCFFILTATPGIAAEINTTENSINPHLFSFEANDENLGDVIKRLSTISRYEIILERQWQDYSVSVNLHDVTLEQALLEILGKKVNHAIIWRPNKQVSIIMSDIPLVRNTPLRQNLPFTQETPGVSLSGQKIRYQQASRTITGY